MSCSGKKYDAGFQVEGLPVGIFLLAVQEILHDEVVGRCATKQTPEASVTPGVEVGGVDQERLRVRFHVRGVGVEKFVAEERVFEFARDRFDKVFAVFGTEECLLLLVACPFLETG